jgi:hypothetical protein
MIGYVLEGASPSNATEDPRAERLMSAGPWMAQPHPRGAVLVWRSDDGTPSRLTEFGDARKTSDGLLFLPPKTLPALDTLVAKNMQNRDDALVIRVVREEAVIMLRIIPAYCSPRKVMDDNTLGEPSTRYGKAVRKLLDRLVDNPSLAFGEYAADLYEVCRLAIMHTHPRMTRELITEYGVLDEDTAFQIWEGTVHVPKDVLDRVNALSASRSPAVG